MRILQFSYPYLSGVFFLPTVNALSPVVPANVSREILYRFEVEAHQNDSVQPVP
jgi:hypothetical protein